MTIGRIPSVEGGIQPTIVDAKGDLIAATAADTVNRLAVGSNDQVLVADSSTSTGLAWKSYGAQFVAGKNKIINGDFNINQRGFSSTTTSGTYGFDRFLIFSSGGTTTWSAETFTPGAAPVAGYESKNFSRLVTSGQSAASSYLLLGQRVEDVRTLAGQTATVSFWAKASTGTPKVGVAYEQSFGSGGSTQVKTNGGNVTISTSWARYSVTVAIPSLSGKTVGTNSFVSLYLFTSAGADLSDYTSIGIQNTTIDIWGVQWEAGSVATPFTTATGTLAGELQAASRYYWRTTGTNIIPYTAYAKDTAAAFISVTFPTVMRVAPTTVEYSNLEINLPGTANYTITAVTLNTAGTNAATLELAASGLTQYRPYLFKTSSTGYLAFSSEL